MGLDGLRLLTTEDTFERQLLFEVARRVSEYEGQRMEVQAQMIAIQVSKIFSKM